MDKQFISYELALKLKDKDFEIFSDNYCGEIFGFYMKNRNSGEIHPIDYFYADTNANIQQWNHLDETLESPLYQQVIQWFLKKHNIFISTTYRRGQNDFDCIIDYEDGVLLVGYCKTEAEALSKGIERALTLI